MNETISNYVSNSILQATAEHVSSTTQRTSELAAYLRLNSVSEHAGGLFSGGIELHVPSTISNIRIGCDSIPTDHSTLVVSDAWIDITGVYRNGHSSGVFHRAQVPITKVVVGRDPHGEFYDADPTSPGTDCLTPRRKFAAAAKRRSGQRSFHSESSNRSSFPSAVGLGEPDGEGNTQYLLHNSKVVIPYKIYVDPRLPNSFSYDGAEICYWVSIVLFHDGNTMKDALVVQSRQVEVYQLESFIATNHDSSSSSSSSKVAMGGPGTLDVAAWVVSPCFGIIEESEAKVTLYIRNFTKKKTQGIKLEVFRIIESLVQRDTRKNMVKIAEEVYRDEDRRFEPGYSAHVTVGIKLPFGSYSSNGIPEVSVSYIMKSLILVPLSDPIAVVCPIRIVRPHSFPEGVPSKPLPKLPVSVSTQTSDISEERSTAAESNRANTYESRLLVAQRSLESILQEPSVQQNNPSDYYYSTSSDDETISTGSYSDSDVDDTPARQAYIARQRRPKFIAQTSSKRKPKIPLTLNTSWDMYENSSYDSHELHNAGLTSDSSRISQWAYQSSVLSPQTPAEFLDDQQLWVRTMSAPNLTMPSDMHTDMKRLSIPSMGYDVESALVDIYKRNNISRRTHVRAVAWRSCFD